MSDDPMVAVLRDHEPADAWGYRTTCSCGGWTSKPMFTTSWRLDAHATHLADVLRAAGYIHRDEQETSAVRAQVWEEGAFHGLGWPAALGYALMASNPYRTPPDHACDERCDHLGEWLGGGAR